MSQSVKMSTLLSFSPPIVPLLFPHQPLLCAMPRRKPRRGAISKPSGPSSKYYGIRHGRDSFFGVVNSWPECSALINGVPGVRFKSFSSHEAALSFSKPVPGEPIPKSKKKHFYGIRGGASGFHGVVNTWGECSLYIKGVPGVKYKGFATYEEAMKFAAPEKGEVSSTREFNFAGDAVSLGELLTTTGARGDATAEKKSQKSAALEEIEKFKLVGTSTTAVDDGEPKKRADHKLIVYTDGACTNNGKPNSMAGYGVFFQEGSAFNISRRLEGHATNQRAEMTAVLEAIRTALQHELLEGGELFEIHTDSQYTKKGFDLWIRRWQRNGWKTTQGTDVKNKDLWMALYDAKMELSRRDISLKLLWVKGHAGNPGNEAADRLAVAGIYGGL